MVTPWPHVLLHGDQSLHCVTGHNGSGISISSAEQSGCMHLFFSTKRIRRSNKKHRLFFFLLISNFYANYRWKCVGTSFDRNVRQTCAFSLKCQCRMMLSTVTKLSMVLCGIRQCLRQHYQQSLRSSPNSRPDRHRHPSCPRERKRK